ncbi:hypothetical protein GCM10019059_20260 [Camelimonas fluminis]|uniref:Glutelin n=1 Tax=Camelimonas fluminis TaxID=1576911 RepID=A0ABV7UL79_9HYPH|nr:hypothetical protein [Camelimonas fluminis]GHE60674.1 hypothetical protein GCM10019059_20260 [Camelimonas fluminis]
MKKVFSIAAALAVMLAAPAFAADKAFECPAIKAGEEPAAVKDLRLNFGKQDPLNDPDALNAAVDKLRKDGANRTLVIDNLISAYCPVVAANTMLNNQQKASRVQRFASVVVPLVYGLESAEEIILNVPLPSSVIDAVNEKARAAKISPEEWAAGAVERALGGK